MSAEHGERVPKVTDYTSNSLEENFRIAREIWAKISQALLPGLIETEKVETIIKEQLFDREIHENINTQLSSLQGMHRANSYLEI